jgi:ubiquinone/menaquinone biosynthesis C-methylase UbiE
MLVGGLLIFAAVVLALLYWQFVIAEGAYLGTRAVTLTYDLAATRYDRIKEYDFEFEAAFLGRPLAAALQALPAPYVLDVGTGTARLPLALFDQPAFNGRVGALDSSRRMLRVAADKLAPFKNRIDLLWLDAARLPFDDATFDAVTCLEMLEFTPDPAAQLAEVIRVLRPGGLLLTTRRRGLDARLMPGKTQSRDQFRRLVESMEMDAVRVLPWQVDYDLVWAMRRGDPAAWMGGLRPLVEVLRCPTCHTGTFVPRGRELHCQQCGSHFLTREGVVELQSSVRRGQRSHRK